MIGSVTDVLARLTALSQELAGAFRPATIVEIVARVLTEQLAPGRLSVMLLDLDSNRLAVAYHNGPRPANTDEPLLQLALRKGPLVFPENVAARAAEFEVTLDGKRTGPIPPSWLGAPILAVTRTIVRRGSRLPEPIQTAARAELSSVSRARSSAATACSCIHNGRSVWSRPGIRSSEIPRPCLTTGWTTWSPWTGPGATTAS